MNYFTISQLEQFSGIKAHTIRVWEQRYNALSPLRSEGNTRYYENSQLRRLLNIVSLSNDAYKVSDLCKMTDDRLFKLLEGKLDQNKIQDNSNEYFISQLILAAVHYDEIHFEKVFSSYVLRFGIKNAYTAIIYPMLNRIGLMWTSNSLSSASEHFASNLIRQKLFSSIDSLPPALDSNETWLLFTPENEFHEIGILFSHYLIRQSGKKSIYLGCNVPEDSLINTVNDLSPSHIYLFLIHHNSVESTQAYLNKLKNKFKKINICISGNTQLISQLKIGKEFNWIKNVEELEQNLN